MENTNVCKFRRNLCEGKDLNISEKFVEASPSVACNRTSVVKRWRLLLLATQQTFHRNTFDSEKPKTVQVTFDTFQLLRYWREIKACADGGKAARWRHATGSHEGGSHEGWLKRGSRGNPELFLFLCRRLYFDLRHLSDDDITTWRLRLRPQQLESSIYQMWVWRTAALYLKPGLIRSYIQDFTASP